MWHEVIEVVVYALSPMSSTFAVMHKKESSRSEKMEQGDIASRSLLRISSARLLDNIGFSTASASALGTIGDLTAALLLRICKQTAYTAEQAGRTDAVLEDVSVVLKDLGMSTGEVVDYANQAPRYPVARKQFFPRASEKEIKERPPHIHNWMPPFIPEDKQKQPKIIRPVMMRGEMAAEKYTLPDFFGRTARELGLAQAPPKLPQENASVVMTTELEQRASSLTLVLPPQSTTKKKKKHQDKPSAPSTGSVSPAPVLARSISPAPSLTPSTQPPPKPRAPVLVIKEVKRPDASAELLAMENQGLSPFPSFSTSSTPAPVVKKSHKKKKNKEAEKPKANEFVEESFFTFTSIAPPPPSAPPKIPKPRGRPPKKHGPNWKGGRTGTPAAKKPVTPKTPAIPSEKFMWKPSVSLKAKEDQKQSPHFTTALLREEPPLTSTPKEGLKLRLSIGGGDKSSSATTPAHKTPSPPPSTSRPEDYWSPPSIPFSDLISKKEEDNDSESTIPMYGAGDDEASTGGETTFPVLSQDDPNPLIEKHKKKKKHKDKDHERDSSEERRYREKKKEKKEKKRLKKEAEEREKAAVLAGLEKPKAEDGSGLKLKFKFGKSSEKKPLTPLGISPIPPASPKISTIRELSPVVERQSSSMSVRKEDCFDSRPSSVMDQNRASTPQVSAPIKLIVKQEKKEKKEKKSKKHVEKDPFLAALDARPSSSASHKKNGSSKASSVNGSRVPSRVDTVPPLPPAAPASPSGDEDEVWICPVCSVAYVDGADMVGCDSCDRWFHWACVGLLIAPPENAAWFCQECAKKSKCKGDKRSSTDELGPFSKKKKH